MRDDQNIPSEEEEGDDQIPAKEVSEDDVFQSEDQEGVDRNSSNRKIPYSGTCLFEETGEILLFNKWN